jgi:hypothetical protein
MPPYHFETSQFGISDQGIHLLRNRFNYQTINFDQVGRLTIEKGKALKHWPLTLIIGIALITFAVYYSLALFNILSDEQGPAIDIYEIVAPLMPFLLGLFCVYFALRKETILKVSTSQMREKRLSLSELEKGKEMDNFQNFLKAKLNPNQLLTIC